MDILVTGGAGFIGSHVVKELVRDGHNVTALDDLSGGSISNLPNECDFENFSLTNKDKLDLLFKLKKFDIVYHIAAYAAENLSHRIRNFNYENNLICSSNVINCCINNGVKKIVFTSSIAVYGHGNPPVKEADRTEPVDPYGIAKLAVEQDIRAAYDFFGGPEYVIFRPHNVIGPNQNIKDKYRNVLGIFIDQAMNGEKLTVFGDGSQKRAFSPIDKVAPIIAGSVFNDKATNRTFNIGSSNAMKVIELAHKVCKKFGKDPHESIKFLDERKEVKDIWSHHGEFEEVFGSAEGDVDKCIDEMVEWAKNEVHGEPQYPIPEV